MLWLDEKYINLLSWKLPLFKKTGQNLYVFRCPLCGDSNKHAFKTRGGFYLPPSSDHYNMGCFNCGASMQFSNFLKGQDSILYEEYRVESFKERYTHQPEPKKESHQKPKVKKFDMASLNRIDTLPDDHLVVKYMESRKIPKKQWNRLYFCPDYQTWIGKFTGKPYTGKDHPRLIIPFFDVKGNVSRIAARAFGNEEPRYLYSVSDKTSTRIYGIDQIDKTKTVYVVEGPLDSLFFDNAVAVGGASYESTELDAIPSKIFVPDNQPRNPDVCKNLKKVIDRGEKVCLWIEETPKDINEMVKQGMSMGSVMSLIEQSTVNGVMAQLKFSDWDRS